MLTGNSLDRELMTRLLDIPEVTMSGFTARVGLTGSGVTILKGRTYFGSWRVTAGTLVWVSSVPGDPSHFEETVDEAVRYTMLQILLDLQRASTVRKKEGPERRLAS